MKTYTEQEIKKYFEYLKKTYQNCRFNEAVQHVECTMFDADWSAHTINQFLEKTTIVK